MAIPQEYAARATIGGLSASARSDFGKTGLTLNGEFSEQSVGEGEEADSHAAEAVVALLPQG